LHPFNKSTDRYRRKATPEETEKQQGIESISGDMTMTTDSASGSHYTIRIRERLDESWAEWFDPMGICYDGDETLLCGTLPDQAALHGMLARVYSLGLQLIAVNPTEKG
jgi:hypothetical protein